MSSVQRHMYPAAPLHGCLPIPPYRYVAVPPSLVAFYTDLLQRRRGLGASLAGRSLPSVVVPSAAAAAASFHSSSSRHLPVSSTVGNVAEDEVSIAATSPIDRDSSTTPRKSLSADNNRYHPYEKTVWLLSSAGNCATADLLLGLLLLLTDCDWLTDWLTDWLWLMVLWYRTDKRLLLYSKEK